MKIFEIQKYKDGYLVRYPDKTDMTKLGEYKETKKLLSTFDEYDDIYKLLNVNTVYKLNKKSIISSETFILSIWQNIEL